MEAEKKDQERKDLVRQIDEVKRRKEAMFQEDAERRRQESRQSVGFALARLLSVHHSCCR